MTTIGIHSTPGRIGYSMQTFTRLMFWPADPRASEVNIRDIAHALSTLCRFGGHAKWFYSVAQHSVLVSRIVDPVFALKGLLHDAEDAVWSAICERFELSQMLPRVVMEADQIALATEMRDMMGGHVHRCDLPDPLPERIEPLSPVMAEAHFLNRFFELPPGEVR
jgi:uncharacterized protein